VAPVAVTEAPPGGLRLLAPIAIALAAGAGVSVQVFLNGRLGERLDSPEITAAANSFMALAIALVITQASGAGRRARMRLRAGSELRPWHLAAGINGAVFLLCTAAIAPKVGLALLTVALVCGQTIGGLVVDHVGLGPAGRRAITRPRTLGVALAIAAVGIGALGAGGDLHVGLLAIIVVAGALVSCQQAAIGHVARATGEPAAAGVANFSVGLIGTATIALIVTGGVPPGGWSAPAGYWLGGLFGALAAFATGKVVQTIGVLRFVLAFIAGQAVGALAIDLVAPANDKTVTPVVVLSVLLTLAAVVSNEVLGRRHERRVEVPVS
jgi:transporter family-2 protein